PDFFAPAPLPSSAEYSSFAPWASALGSVARCQMPRNTPRKSSESSAGAKLRAFISGRLPDGEAGQVLLRLRRVELPAHHLELPIARGGRLHLELRHVAAGVGGEEHLLGDGFVVHFALDVAPALHLREDPYSHRLPGEGIEVGAVGDVLHVAQAVGETP